MYLTKLYPTPSSYEKLDGEPFRFGAKCRLLLPAKTSPELIENVRKLWRRFTFESSELDIRTAGTGCYAIFFAPDGVVPNSINPGKYYKIRTDSRSAVVAGISEKALADGISMLVQLIIPESLEGDVKFYIPPTKIESKPSLDVRMLHLCVFPESRLETLEKAISLAGFLGFTHIVLEFWGMLEYELNPAFAWRRAFTKEQIRPLVSLARGYGMEVIPMLNHLGHASQSRVGMGRHTILNQNPKLQLLFEPDGWTWCISNPETRKVLSELRGELISLCGDGDYFHLGCDEAYSFATCPICREHVPHELLAEFLNGITEALTKLGRRPIIWHDQLLKRSDCDSEFKEPIVVCDPLGIPAGDTTPAIDLLDRRIIIADWQYSYTTSANPSTPFFIEKGFDVLCCPWDDHRNVRGLCESARSNGAMGVMLTTWHHLPDYIPKMFYFASCVWKNDSYESAPRSEAAAILRKLGDFGDYEVAGWSPHEVDG